MNHNNLFHIHAVQHRVVLKNLWIFISKCGSEGARFQAEQVCHVPLKMTHTLYYMVTICPPLQVRTGRTVML